MRHKFYGDLQSLSIVTYQCKNLFIDFVISLPVFTNKKSEIYYLILIIVDWLTKMVYYQPVKIIVDVPDLVKVIINTVVRHHGLPNPMVSNRGSVFTSKFRLWLCYFFGIKRKDLTTLRPQINGQTKKQNSTMEDQLQAFLNFE